MRRSIGGPPDFFDTCRLQYLSARKKYSLRLPEFATSRAHNLYYYGDRISLWQLAAPKHTHFSNIAVFVDGNKRVASSLLTDFGT
ncbi:Fic family protein [Rubidibacter lacunae]|uniref:Fic family protein n=1 Tax=Rubidibacter lacunae TaxID=582514 RepID=UPI0038CD8D8D